MHSPLPNWHALHVYLACAVRLWDVRTGECCRLFVGHKDKVGAALLPWLFTHMRPYAVLCSTAVLPAHTPPLAVH